MSFRFKSESVFRMWLVEIGKSEPEIRKILDEPEPPAPPSDAAVASAMKLFGEPASGVSLEASNLERSRLRLEALRAARAAVESRPRQRLLRRLFPWGTKNTVR